MKIVSAVGYTLCRVPVDSVVRKSMMFSNVIVDITISRRSFVFSLRIKYGNIHFHTGYVAINLDISKADQLRKGNQVVISEGLNDYTCPVKIFKRYLCQLERFPVDVTHYVFRALSKTKSGHSLVFVNKLISYSSIRDYFKTSFKDIVPDIALFSIHSLRADGASAAANACVAERLFQRHGRWKSVSAKNGYVDDSLSSRLSVSKSLGI